MSEKRSILICGGGNGAHVLTALASCRQHLDVYTLSLYADEADRWQTALQSAGGRLVVSYRGKADHERVGGSPKLITNDPSVAKNAHMIILISFFEVYGWCVPSFAHSQYLSAVSPFVKPGVIVVGLPGYGGFEFDVKGNFGEAKAKETTIMNLDTLPWACRIKEFGCQVEILGTKESIAGAFCYGQPKPNDHPVELLQSILGDLPVLKVSGHLLGITLTDYIHPTIMYGRWKNWDGKPFDKAPLFYQGIDRETADLLTAINEEMLKIVDILKEKVDLSMVVTIKDWYLNCYANDIADKTDLFSCMTTNKSYDGLTHPCRQEGDKFVADFSHRYITEDIPFGLVVLRGLAEIVGVPTPRMDEVIGWCEGIMGVKYLDEAGRLNGPAVAKSRCPQKYGLNTLDQIL